MSAPAPSLTAGAEVASDAEDTAADVVTAAVSEAGEVFSVSETAGASVSKI